MFDRELKRNNARLWSASSAKGVVATAHYLATEAGVRVLERGGNAIDAAVTAALAIGVCEPVGSGLGGMAMMLVHDRDAGRTFAISGACRAPSRATPEAVASSPRYRGYRAIATPTNLAVLRHVLSRYGTMKPSDVLQPAIELAEAGVPISRLQQSITRDYKRSLAKRNAAALFLGEDGEPHAAGTRFRQQALAHTLRRLARHGFDDFYTGEIAGEICSDMRAHDGFIEEDDLAEALRIEETVPLRTSWRSEDILTLGPPGGGLALLQMLRMASFLEPDALDMNTGEGVARVAAIIGRARQDRRDYRLRTRADAVGEAAELLEEEHARRAVEAALGQNGGSAATVAKRLQTSGETSHLSVMDAAGNAVALTQSIERSFGAAVMTPSLGFLYNGYLRAFKVKNRKHPYYLRPGAPARSNAAPTIVLDGGSPRACLGSAGSERMISGMFEVLLRLRDSPPFEAVDAPRLHCTPERHVLWEEARFPEGFRDALVERGFTVEALDPYSYKMGGLQLVVRQDGQCIGVADPRRDGAAAVPFEIAE